FHCFLRYYFLRYSFKKRRADRVQEYVITEFDKPLNFIFRCAYDKSYFTIEVQGGVDAEVRVIWGGISKLTSNYLICGKIDSLKDRRFGKQIRYKHTVECTNEGYYQLVNFHPL